MNTASQFSFNLLPAPSQTTNTDTLDDYTLQWPLENQHPHHFNSFAEQAFTQLQGRYQHLASKSSSDMPDDTSIMVFPIIQAGQFNIREEESFFKLLFKHLRSKTFSRRPVLDFTSGYFSIFKTYRDLILNSRQVDTRIVAAAPKVCIAVYWSLRERTHTHRPMDFSVLAVSPVGFQRGIPFMSNVL